MNDHTTEIIKKIIELDNIQDTYWLDHTLFTWQWWIGVSLTIIPWILWLFFRKKESTNRLLFIGFFVMIFTSYMDFLGVELTLWYYSHKVLPTIPAYIPWDFSLFPVTIMFLLQYKPKFNPFIKALCFGIFAAFIAEPFFGILQLYTPITWKSVYSLPIYIALYLISHFLSRRYNFEPL